MGRILIRISCSINYWFAVVLVKMNRSLTVISLKTPILAFYSSLATLCSTCFMCKTFFKPCLVTPNDFYWSFWKFLCRIYYRRANPLFVPITLVNIRKFVHFLIPGVGRQEKFFKYDSFFLNLHWHFYQKLLRIFHEY